MKYTDLRYLQKKPKVVRWKIVAQGYDKTGKPKELSFYETYDLIYDEHDLKIRQLGKYQPKLGVPTI